MPTAAHHSEGAISSLRAKDINVLPEQKKNIDLESEWENLVETYKSWKPTIFVAEKFSNLTNEKLFYLAYKAINTSKLFMRPRMAEIARSFLTKVDVNQVPEHFLNKMTSDNWLSLVKQGRGQDKNGQPLSFVSEYAKQLFTAAVAVFENEKSRRDQWCYALEVLDLLTKCENDSVLVNSYISAAHLVLACSILFDKSNDFLENKIPQMTNTDRQFNNKTFDIERKKRDYYENHIEDFKLYFSNNELGNGNTQLSDSAKKVQKRLQDMDIYNDEVVRKYNYVLNNPHLVSKLEEAPLNKDEQPQEQLHSLQKRRRSHTPEIHEQIPIKDINGLYKNASILGEKINSFVEKTKDFNDAITRTREEILAKIHDFLSWIIDVQLKLQRKPLQRINTPSDSTVDKNKYEELLLIADESVISHAEQDLNKDRSVIYIRNYMEKLQGERAKLIKKLTDLEEDYIKDIEKLYQAAKDEYQDILLKMYCDNSGFFVGGKRKITRFKEIPQKEEKESLLLKYWPKRLLGFFGISRFLSPMLEVFKNKYNLRNFVIGKVKDLQGLDANNEYAQQDKIILAKGKCSKLIESIRTCGDNNRFANEIMFCYEPERLTDLQKRFSGIIECLNHETNKYNDHKQDLEKKAAKYVTEISKSKMQIDEKKADLVKKYFDEQLSKYKQQELDNFKTAYQNKLNELKTKCSEMENLLGKIREGKVSDVLASEHKEKYQELEQELSEISKEIKNIESSAAEVPQDEEVTEEVTRLKELHKSLKNIMLPYSEKLYPIESYLSLNSNNCNIQEQFKDYMVNIDSKEEPERYLAKLKELLETLVGYLKEPLLSSFRDKPTFEVRSNIIRSSSSASKVGNGHQKSKSESGEIPRKHTNGKNENGIKETSEYLLSFIRQSCEEFVKRFENSPNFEKTFWNQILSGLKSDDKIGDAMRYVLYLANDVFTPRITEFENKLKTHNNKKSKTNLQYELNFCKMLVDKVNPLNGINSIELNVNKINPVVDALTKTDEYLTRLGTRSIRHSRTFDRKNEIYQNLLQELLKGAFKESSFAIEQLRQSVNDQITNEVDTVKKSNDFRKKVNELFDALEKFIKVSSLKDYDYLHSCVSLQQLPTELLSQLLYAIQKSCEQFTEENVFQGGIPDGVQKIQTIKANAKITDPIKIKSIQDVIIQKLKAANEFDPSRSIERAANEPEKVADSSRISKTREFYESLNNKIEHVIKNVETVEQAFGDVLKQPENVLLTADALAASLMGY